MEPNAKAKNPEDVKVRMKPLPLQNNLFLYMIIGAGIIVAGTIAFLLVPTIGEIGTLRAQIAQNEEDTQKANTSYNEIKARMADLSQRTKVVKQTIDNAMSREILPANPNQTEFVRFLEKKVNALNTSERNSLQLNNVSFMSGNSPVSGVQATSATLELSGSEENFYRFIQELENNGSIIVVKKVNPASPLAEKVREGDIVRSVIECADENMTAPCTESPVIYSWVALEKLQQLVTGTRGVFLQIRRYDESANMWRMENIEYVPTEEMPNMLDADGLEIEGQKDPGIELDLSDEYTRQISVESISAQMEEGDEITGEGAKMKFSVELNTYYLPRN